MRPVCRGYSDVGGRGVNEDFAYLWTAENCAKLCAVVADGLGGHGGGDVASEVASRVIKDGFIAERSNKPKDVYKYFAAANNEILKINGGKNTTLTTVVALFLDGQSATYSHLGDSRLYHFVNGELTARTLDHSVPQVAVALGEIDESQIRCHPDRNRVLKALGVLPSDEFTIDVKTLRLDDGNSHAFLLCTDGFWEYVYEAEMVEALKNSASVDDWLTSMRKIRDSRAPDDSDNNTAVVIMV